MEGVCVEGSAEGGLHYHCTLNSNSKNTHRVSLLHHGGDVLIAGTRADVKAMTQKFRSVFIVKVRGMLGQGHDELESISMLNRVIQWEDGTTDNGNAF